MKSEAARSDLLAYLGELKRLVPRYGELLEHGQFWETGARPRPKGMRKLADRGCFLNAWRRAMDTGWRYVEGVASASIDSVYVDHAWIVDDEGIVVETTRKVLGQAYFGLVIPLTQVSSLFMSSGRAQSVLAARSISRRRG